MEAVCDRRRIAHMPSSPPPLESVAWLSPEGYGDQYPEGAYVEVMPDGSFGSLVVCVNETPTNPIDPSCHFERYEGDVADYYFKQRPEGTVRIGENGEREFVPASEGLVADRGGVGAIPVEES